MNAERIAELRADAGNRFVSRMGRVCLDPAEALELLDLVKAQRVALAAADYLREAVCRDLDDSTWTAVREQAEAYQEARAKTLG